MSEHCRANCLSSFPFIVAVFLNCCTASTCHTYFFHQSLSRHTPLSLDKELPKGVDEKNACKALRRGWVHSKHSINGSDSYIYPWPLQAWPLW